MIVDTLDRLAAYRCLSPLIEPAIAFLRDHPGAPDGRYDLRGDQAFAMVQTYTTEPAAAKRWEAHRTYVDVQVVLEGAEVICYAPLTTLTESAAYDPAADLAWFTGTGGFVPMPAGAMMILHPRDGHMPGVTADRPRTVRKAVIKLAVASFLG